MVHIPVEFTCRYPVKFVPKGARKARTKHFRAKNAAVMIEKLHPNELVPVFRLHKLDIWDDMLSREILLHEGRYFWPLSFWHSETDQVTEHDLLLELKFGGNDIFHQQKLTRAEPFLTRTAMEDVPMREMLDNGYECTMLACQKKAGQLLLCDGQAYVSAGEPLFVIHHEFGVLDIVAAGPDRSARPDIDWLSHEVADTNRREIRSGMFLDASYGAQARKLLPASSKRRQPAIDVLFASAPKAPPFEIRIDSIFRDLVVALGRIDKSYYDRRGSAKLSRWPSAEGLRHLEMRVLSAADQPLDSPDLSVTRLRVLQECQRLGLGGNIFLEHLASLFTIPEVTSMLNNAFSTEQDDAIAALHEGVDRRNA